MNATRISLIIALAAGALLALSPALRAEDTKESKDAPKREGRPGGKGGEGMKAPLDKMTEDLKLTDEQKKKVEELFKSQGEKRREMQNATPEERKAFRDEMDKKFKEILTKDQYEKWQKDRPQGGPGAGGKGKKRGPPPGAKSEKN